MFGWGLGKSRKCVEDRARATRWFVWFAQAKTSQARASCPLGLCEAKTEAQIGCEMIFDLVTLTSCECDWQ